jgi:hypothetical protein
LSESQSSEICGKWWRKRLRKTHQLLQSFRHFSQQYKGLHICGRMPITISWDETQKWRHY